ncbi:MAG TPA: PQQ-binding-like beta-propeller repeat protein [Planctomycetota bacterium]|nr:PQQ-binding-like beta-propeller repeat protein [Planctomycetota bacterium]HRT95188.1 PQQ-binding-like beta-propeller repeat protein [Planctomycetota bacterium]
MRGQWVILAAALCGAIGAADWPQLQNGPQRLGYSPEKIEVPFRRAWAVGMSPERLHPQAQPVIADGRVFIGTAMANFHAFEAKTGKKLWTFKAGGPVLHTAGVEGGKVFFGCLGGCVYALDAAKGELAWKFDSGLRTGFSTAVLLADGNVFIAKRGGVYYALSQRDGKVVWQRDLGVPILMSSAYDEGRLFVGAMDMRIYALDAKTGEVAWRSDTVSGIAFRDYWPVVYKDYVLIRPAKASGLQPNYITIEWLRGPLPEPELAKQEKVIAGFEKDPTARNLFVLDRMTGKEAFVVPHWVTNTMNGATIPPCVDGDGLLIIPVTLHDWRGGWGRLDLGKRRVLEVLTEEAILQGGYKAGTGNGDENMTVTCVGRLVLTWHTEESNAHYTGIWHLDKRVWTHVPPLHADGFFTSNTQGGGGNPPAIADAMAFHTSWNTLNARTATPAQ